MEKKSKRIKDKASGGGRRWRVGSVFFFNFYYYFSHFFLRSMKIGPQVFVGTEGKVDLRDESYAWTPKSWSFVKLYEVGNFPTCVISILKAI